MYIIFVNNFFTTYMQISLSQSNGIRLQGKDKTPRLLLSAKSLSDKPKLLNEFELIFDGRLTSKNLTLYNPCEVEVSGISVLAQSSKENGILDVVQFILEGITILYFEEGAQYSKRIHNNIGVTDVFILSIKEGKNLDESWSKFDPGILIPLVTGVNESSQALLSLGISTFEKVSKLNLSIDDLRDENVPFRTYVLE